MLFIEFSYLSLFYIYTKKIFKIGLKIYSAINRIRISFYTKENLIVNLQWIDVFKTPYLFKDSIYRIFARIHKYLKLLNLSAELAS